MPQATRNVRQSKPKKPYPDFPLYPHTTGRWAKKIRGKLWLIMFTKGALGAAVTIEATNNTGLLRSVEDVTVRGNVFTTEASASKLGTECRAESMPDITFIDNDVVACDRGMSLSCGDGGIYSAIR